MDHRGRSSSFVGLRVEPLAERPSNVPEGDIPSRSETGELGIECDILPSFRRAKAPHRYGLQRNLMAETRKLAAILAADVVGYSRLAGADEDRTRRACGHSEAT
jgi:hypothetical protein